jgi:hypothetical protein
LLSVWRSAFEFWRMYWNYVTFYKYKFFHSSEISTRILTRIFTKKSSQRSENSQVSPRVKSERFIRVESESSQNRQKSAKSSQVRVRVRVKSKPWFSHLKCFYFFLRKLLNGHFFASDIHFFAIILTVLKSLRMFPVWHLFSSNSHLLGML